MTTLQLQGWELPRGVSLPDTACETGLRARGGVAVDDSEARRTIDQALGLHPLGLDGVLVTRGKGFVKPADGGAQARASRTVVGVAPLVLTHSFLGRLDDRHFLKSSIDVRKEG